jgi:transcriptional regulator NrdR family protein
MINQVIKKDGSQEPFNPEKIKNSIKTSSKDAGLDEAKQKELAETISKKVIEEIGDRNVVTALEIKEKVLAELDLIAPSASTAWRNYEANKNQ